MFFLKKAWQSQKIHSKKLLCELGFLFFAFLAFFFGCEFLSNKPPFENSYYTDNLISSIGFDKFVGNQVPDPDVDFKDGKFIVPCGVWDFVYRGNSASFAFDYIQLQEVTEAGFATAGDVGFGTVPTGLEPTAKVYRVTIPNLIAPTGLCDRGDFEEADGEWQKITEGENPPEVLYETGTSFGLNDTRLAKISCPQGASVVYVAKSTDGYAFVDGMTYKITGQQSCVDNFLVGVKTNDMSNQPLSKQDEKKLLTGQFTFKASSLPSALTTPNIYFSPTADSNFANLYIDNLEVTRTDGMLLRLRLRPTDTTPKLVNGVYSFSVWVRADYDADVSSRAEPRNLPQLKINIENPPESVGTLASKSQVFTNHGKSSNPSSPDTWHKITSTLSGKALQFSETDSPVLDLVLDFSNTSSGRILLTAPELRFHPDGI